MNFDLPPQNEEERDELRETIRKQMEETPELVKIKVCCPKCGKTVPVRRAVRCMDCGLYFCEPCAKEHFDIAKERCSILREELDAAQARIVNLEVEYDKVQSFDSVLKKVVSPILTDRIRTLEKARDIAECRVSELDAQKDRLVALVKKAYEEAELDWEGEWEDSKTKALLDAELGLSEKRAK